MEVTPRQLNRATLERQLLLKREAVSVVGAARRAFALQAQEPASPYVALWNRVAGFDPGHLDAAFANGTIVKAPLMRITLHAVLAEEYTTFHEAMLENLRAARLNDRRFRGTGLSIDEIDALVPSLVRFANETRDKEEIEALLEDHLGGAPDRHVWWALRTFSPLVHAPTGGPWSYGQRPSYSAAPTAPPRVSAEKATQRLIVRYLEAFGPATTQDVGQFSMLRQSQLRPAFAALEGSLLTYTGVAGETLYDVPSHAAPDAEFPAPPRLLGMWDSVLLAYSDRSRVIPEEYRKIVIRNNGDVLPTLLVDGFVAGVWRHIGNQVEARAFSALHEDVWAELAAEAEGLLELLEGRDENLYGRYDRWWLKLPEGETRMLGA